MSGSRQPVAHRRGRSRLASALPLLLPLLLPGLPTLARGQEPRTLEGPEAIEDLCHRIDPPDGMIGAPPGDPITRGWLRARQEAQRDAALTASYRVVLRAEEFHFDDFDPAAGLLPLHLDDGLDPFGGRTRLLTPGESVRLRLTLDEAQRLVEEHSTHGLRLSVDFLLDPGHGERKVCGVERELTSRPVRVVHIIPQSYRWLDEAGRLIAAAAGEPSGAGERARVNELVLQARVRVDAARLIDGPPGGSPTVIEVEEQIAGLLLPCLQDRITVLGRPLEGSLLMELDYAATGSVDQIVFRQRLLDDPPLLRCVTRQLSHSRLPLPSGSGPRHLLLPVFFQSTPLE